ncbi:hypothetical protein D3C81_1979320 [compost metagenome]
METGGLIVQHAVVGHWNPNKEIHPGSGQKHREIIHIILVCLHMIRIADVDTHGYPLDFPHEMIFQSGADHLLAVIQILRAYKSDHCIHQKRLETLRKPITAGFQGYLVYAMMSAR